MGSSTYASFSCINAMRARLQLLGLGQELPDLGLRVACRCQRAETSPARAASDSFDSDVGVDAPGGSARP